jgi:hypothetical protein
MTDLQTSDSSDSSSSPPSGGSKPSEGATTGDSSSSELSGGDLTAGPIKPNAMGEPQVLDYSVCNGLNRGDDCVVKVDVPTGCAGGSDCPLIYFLHGAGGSIRAWPDTASPLLHSSDAWGNKFIGIYP